AGNVIGTGAMLSAAEKAGIARFVHVSSLAAREPRLSLYGASKARSETLVAASPLATAIVRPPAIYGPGDRELLDMFKMAARGFVLLPPPGRLSLLHVDDLARLLLALAGPAAPGGLTVEPDDGHSGGWTHDEFAGLLGAAVGRKVRSVSMPQLVMATAARADRLLRGARAKLTPDRAAYFCHPDWVADPAVPSGLTVEPDDGHSGGWTHDEFADLLGAAVGRKVRTVSMPRLVMAAAARTDRLLRGARAKLTPDRAAYFCHPDWVADPAKAIPQQLWKPAISTPQGLTETAAWYRSNNLL
ncbi:MAG TPA: NAD-dependent epimerase/dehydratase family protein, partial [Sphingomicrobium sp.]|nr:NAD-dependent epimerase/dehydratase family protein [Sphingomicrobium sp.]